MATPGFYNQADQALYDQGNYFLPQEKYRVDLGTSTGVPNRVEFNPSQNGIGSLQQPYPYMVIIKVVVVVVVVMMVIIIYPQGQRELLKKVLQDMMNWETLLVIICLHGLWLKMFLVL
jgi:hypothetical protein